MANIYRFAMQVRSLKAMLPKDYLMLREKLIEQIEERLGARKLIWFGTRGEDAQPLLHLHQFSESFSLIAPLNSLSAVDYCLEIEKGSRIDLDSYSLDADESKEAMLFRRRLLESLQEPAVIVPYRPLGFLSSVYYPRSSHVDLLGLFHERQAPFEHKPWVESELQKQGIRTLPWRYFADEDRKRIEEILAQFGAVVLRTIRTDGGAGFTLIRSLRELAEKWHVHREGFFAAAPLLSPHIPLNVNACLFADGTVSFHAPSLQLIGLADCTKRPCGYCGNDFAAAKEFGDRFWDELEEMLIRVSKWLAAKGYLGAFGVDAIIYQGDIYLAEINPRFQGSSAVGALIDEMLGRADMFLCHIAAFLGLPGRNDEHLKELVRAQPPLSQIVCHNINEHPVRRVDVSQIPAHGPTYSLLPSEELEVEKEAILFKKVTPNSVTPDGLSLSETEAREVAFFAENSFEAVQMHFGWERVHHG